MFFVGTVLWTMLLLLHSVSVSSKLLIASKHVNMTKEAISHEKITKKYMVSIYIHSRRKVLSARVFQGEGLAASTLLVWFVSLSQKRILGVSFLGCCNFSGQNNMQHSLEFVKGRNVKRFYFYTVFLVFIRFLKKIFDDRIQ